MSRFDDMPKLKAQVENEIRQAFLQVLSAGTDQVVFMQIGGNDGALADPLKPHIQTCNWRGIIVEPVPNYFSKLQKLYSSNANIMLEQAACSADTKPLTMFYLKEESEARYPNWARGLASSYWDHLEKHGIHEVDCDKCTVDAIPAHALLKKHSIEALDLLCVDVEGHETAVFDGVDFNDVRCKSVLFERKHLKPDETQRIHSKLAAHEFEIFEFAQDTIAVNRECSEMTASIRGFQRIFQRMFV